ncbi:MAG: EAL domain-containing protein [Clostridiales bacterium]|nr:EAL domain-containing protein [Clostridiales bacterium]
MSKNQFSPAQINAVQVLKDMMYAYLVERDAEKMLSYFTDQMQSIGTGKQEISFQKEELRFLVEEEITNDPTPFSIDFQDIKVNGNEEESIIFIYAAIEVSKPLPQGQVMTLDIRQTATLMQVGDTFQIGVVHVSFPASQQEEREYFPITFGGKCVAQIQSEFNHKIFSFLNENMPGGLLGVYEEPGFPLYFINDNMLEYLGYDYDEFVEATDGMVLNCIYSDDREMVSSQFQECLKTEQAYIMVYRMIKKDNSFLWIYDKGKHIITEDGREAVINICLDITEQVETKDQLYFISQSPLCGLFKARVDEYFTLLYANDCYYDLHGYTREQLEEMGGRAIELVHPEDVQRVSDLLQKAVEERQKTISFEYRILRRDGAISWFDVSAGFSNTNEGLILSGMLIDVTERKEVLQKLELSEERFRIAMSQTRIHVWEYDIKNRRMFQTERSQEVHGLGAVIENVPDSLIENGHIHPDSVEDFLEMYRKIISGVESADCIIRVRTPEGQYWWEKIHYTTIFDGDGNPIRAVAVSEDVSAQKEAEQRAFQEIKLREMLSIDIIAFTKINLTKNYVESLWSCEEEKLHWNRKNLVTYGQVFHLVLGRLANEEDKKRFVETMSYQKLLKAYEQGKTTLYQEYRCNRVDGKIVWMSFTTTMDQEPNSRELFFFCYLRDIDEKKKIELALKERAERDSLTGLYNKQTVQSMIEETIHQNYGVDGYCALLMIDLDDFKQINDHYGHLYGDNILSEIGRILQVVFDVKSIAGRFGGDEFLVLLEHVPSYQWVYQKIEKLRQELNLVSLLDKDNCNLSVSVGITFSTKNNADFQMLYQQADDALYDAKWQGKNRYAVYNPEKQDRIRWKPFMTGCIGKDQVSKNCLLDEFEDVVFVIDCDTNDILYMNHAARKVFSLDEFRCSQSKCYQVIYGFSEPCIFCKNHLPEENKFKVWESTNSKLHKRFLVRDKIIYWGGKKARLEIFSDLISWQKQENHEHLMSKILLECTSALLSCKTLEKAFHTALECIGNFYHAEHTYLISNKNQELTFPYFSWSQDNSMDRFQSIIGEKVSSWFDPSKGKNAIFLNNLSEAKIIDHTHYEILEQNQIHSFYAIALIDCGRVIGHIAVINPKEYLGQFDLLESLSYFLISELIKRTMQENQDFLAYHDGLTGLLNRESYYNYIHSIQEDTLSSMGVLVVDINGMRAINKKYGLEYGDELLKNVANILKASFDSDYVYRFIGDEFLVLSQDIAYNDFIKKVEIVRQKIDEFYSNMVSFGHTWSNSGISISRMMQHADEMIALEKSAYYTEIHQNHYSNLRNRLNISLRNHQFQIYLQPKIDLATQEVYGAEALVRYIDPKFGVMAPDKFLPQFEENKLIRYIDFFVMEEVCRTLRKWKHLGIPLIPISFNFSRATLLEQGLLEEMNRITNQYNIDPQFLEIEITESFGMERKKLTEIGNCIMKEGYRLSLDDFGAEYSNIYVLSSLPLHALKIDKSVIQDLYSNPYTKIIMKNMMAICRQMGIESVAEGVETTEQEKILQSLGCNYAQGYLYSKPISVVDFEKKYYRFLELGSEKANSSLLKNL